MDPKKKVFNPKTSPWLLCPSKSFPGKFYYFNGSTGETAWSLNDTDNKNHRKDTICSIADNTHAYPEPFGPPADNPSNSSSTLNKELIKSAKFDNTTNFSNRATFANISNLQNDTNCSTQINFSSGSFKNGTGLNLSRNTRGGLTFNNNVTRQSPTSHSLSSPSFGQVAFPRYVSNDAHSTKVIWALTPIPEHTMPREMLDQITQYELQEEMFQPSAPLPKHSQTFKGFTTKGNPILFTPLQKQTFNLKPAKFDPKPQTKEKTFKGFTTKGNPILFTPLQKQTFNLKPAKFDPKPQTNEKSCQTISLKTKSIQTQPESDPPKSVLICGENSASTAEKVKSTLSLQDKVDEVNAASNFGALGRDDLRLKLVAKRRKSVDCGDILQSAEGPSKYQRTAMKRVTFDFGDQVGTSSVGIQKNVTPSPEPSQCDYSLDSAGTTTPLTPPTRLNPIWYIAVDTGALLDKFEYIEKFVLSDKNCRLLIPYIVKSDVDALSRNECGGRQGAFPARQIARKLSTPTPHIVVQRIPATVSAYDEAILECCWQNMQDSHVILLTNDAKLSQKAKSVDLKCHTLDVIKNDSFKVQEPFNITKVKITSNHKSTENLFQQTIKELNAFRLKEPVTFPANGVKRRSFDSQSTQNTIFGEKETNSDKLVRVANTYQNLKTVCNPEIDEIGHDIAKLDITDDYLTLRRPALKGNHNSDMTIINGNDYRHISERRAKDSIKISGITKLNSVFNLDDELSMYYIKNNAMENRVKSRLDEWVCRLTQTMEEVLTDILIKDNFKVKKKPPPWNFLEAVEHAGDRFKSQPKINTIIERFSSHLSNCANAGKFNTIKPNDFIKLVGFSMILVHNLKDTIDYIELNDADDLLSELIKNIEDPGTDEDLTLGIVETPVLGDVKETTRSPVSYKTKEAFILEYLKTDFIAMQSYETEKPAPKVVRTVGKDLKTLRMYCTKSRNIENADHCNAIEVINSTVVEPKVIRNFKEKLKRLSLMELDTRYDERDEVEHDTENNNEFIDKREEVEHHTGNNDDFNDKCDEAEHNTENDVDFNDDEVEHFTENIDEFIDKRDYTKNENSDDEVDWGEDSDIHLYYESISSDANNESIYAYPLLKLFFFRLRKALVSIYNFITRSVKLYQESISEVKKANIETEINTTHTCLQKIIGRLESIIARETTTSDTIKKLLIQAGKYDDRDIRMAAYPQLVGKFLEQAKVLEESLMILLKVPRKSAELESMSTE